MFSEDLRRSWTGYMAVTVLYSGHFGEKRPLPVVGTFLQSGYGFGAGGCFVWVPSNNCRPKCIMGACAWDGYGVHVALLNAFWNYFTEYLVLTDVQNGYDGSGMRASCPWPGLWLGSVIKISLCTSESHCWLKVNSQAAHKYSMNKKKHLFS